MRFTETDLNELLWERHFPKGFTSRNGLAEQSVRLQHPLFALEYYGICLEGVHLGYGQWQQNQPMQLKLQNDSAYLEMHVNLSGNQLATLKDTRQAFTFSPKEHNLFYLPPIEKVFETSPQVHPARTLRIKFTESYFTSLAREEIPLLSPMREAIRKQQPALLGLQNRKITPQMEFISEIFYSAINRDY